MLNPINYHLRTLNGKLPSTIRNPLTTQQITLTINYDAPI